MKKHHSKAMDQMTDDLMQHFGKRLQQLLYDTVHTCQIGEVGMKECIALMLSPMTQETIKLALALGMDDEDFAKFTATSYRHVLELMEKHHGAPNK